MCDDEDWDAPSISVPPGTKLGVISEGGCKFSSGRGFVPADRNDKPQNVQTFDSWGNFSDTTTKSNGNNNGGDWDESPVDFSWTDNSNSASSRGRKGGSRGGRGFRGGRGASHNHNERDERNQRGSRGGGRGKRPINLGPNGDSNNDDQIERKKENYIPQEIENIEDLFHSGISSGVNFMKLDEIEVNVTGNDPPLSVSSFEEMGLRQHILGNIGKSGYLKPTPIQKYSIPVILNGRDLMSCAQTGSGKTAAFLLPIIHNLLTNKNPPNIENRSAHPNVVIMSPTRELAIQIADQAKKFSYNSTIKVDIAYGGTVINHQRNKILSGCHILVATPGRLKDFVNRGYVSFADVKYFVLDEADRMLDMGFLGDVEEMLSHPTMPATGERQTLMFSATFPEEIQQLASRFLHNYIFLAVGIVGSASTDVEQIFFQISKFEKRSKLLSILEQNPNERTLIFVETKRNADFLATFLSEQNIQTTSIHGDRYQSQREKALDDFKSGQRKILVATGVAARGLDIKDVQHVINFDLPNSIDEYVHRIGRTGRVGNRGKATSFFDEEHDRNLASALAKILSQAKQEVPDWLGNFTQGGSMNQFGGRDIRGDDFGRGQEFSSVEEDEAW